MPLDRKVTLWIHSSSTLPLWMAWAVRSFEKIGILLSYSPIYIEISCIEKNWRPMTLWPLKSSWVRVPKAHCQVMAVILVLVSWHVVCQPSGSAVRNVLTPCWLITLLTYIFQNITVKEHKWEYHHPFVNCTDDSVTLTVMWFNPPMCVRILLSRMTMPDILFPLSVMPKGFLQVYCSTLEV